MSFKKSFFGASIVYTLKNLIKYYWIYSTSHSLVYRNLKVKIMKYSISYKEKNLIKNLRFVLKFHLKG